jgi:hypothetical protein
LRTWRGSVIDIEASLGAQLIHPVCLKKAKLKNKYVCTKYPSFPRKLEPTHPQVLVAGWVPAFAGMTDLRFV